MYRMFIAACAIFFSAYLPANSQQMTKVVLSTGWILQGGSAPLVLADERGYFKEANVDVDIVRGFGSADVITKVAAGTYHAGTGYLPSLMKAIADNPDLDAIAVMISYDSSPDAITGPKASGIKKPADLANRKLSAQPNSTTMLIFQPFAKAVGLDPNSVKWVEVAPQLIGVTVYKGQADGAGQFATSAVANFARLGWPRDKLYQFKFSDYVDNLYGNALILQKSWAKANPKAAKGVVRAYVKGLIDARKDPKAAIAALIKREPLLKPSVEMVDLNYSNENYYFTSRVLEKGLAYHGEEDLNKFIKLLSGPFSLKRVPAVSEIYTTEYLPDANELKVSK